MALKRKKEKWLLKPNDREKTLQKEEAQKKKGRLHDAFNKKQIEITSKIKAANNREKRLQKELAGVKQLSDKDKDTFEGN